MEGYNMSTNEFTYEYEDCASLSVKKDRSFSLSAEALCTFHGVGLKLNVSTTRTDGEEKVESERRSCSVKIKGLDKDHLIVLQADSKLWKIKKFVSFSGYVLVVADKSFLPVTSWNTSNESHKKWVVPIVSVFKDLKNYINTQVPLKDDRNSISAAERRSINLFSIDIGENVVSHEIEFECEYVHNYTLSHPPRSEVITSFMDDVAAYKQSLFEYKQTNLQIERLLYDEMSLEDNYSPLCIMSYDNIRSREKVLEGSYTADHYETIETYKQMNERKDELVDYKELLPTKPGDWSVLITGTAGVGKTTLCKKLACSVPVSDWCFFIPIRNLNSARYPKLDDNKVYTLGDIFRKEGCPFRIGNQHWWNVFFDCIAHADQEKYDKFFGSSDSQSNVPACLVILDGFDEKFCIPDYLEPLFSELMRCKQVILSSRPYNLSGLTTYYNFPKLIWKEVTGFTEKTVESYIKHFFESPDIANPLEGKALLNHLKCSDYMFSSCKIPVNCEMICTSWDTGTLRSSMKNMSELYTALLNYLSRRYVRKFEKLDKPYENMNQREFDSKCKYLVAFLEYFAFNGLVRGNLFSDDVAATEYYQNVFKAENAKESTEDIIALQLKFGFIRRVVQSGDSRFYFNHLTLRDYFAARYIANAIQKASNSTRNPLSSSFLRFYILDSQGQEDQTIKDVKTFLEKEIFNPVYEYVLWYVVGLLAQIEDHDSLAYFYDCVLNNSQKKDATGFYTSLLVIRCFDESCQKISDQGLKDRLAIIVRDWLQCSFESQENYQYGKLSTDCAISHRMKLCKNLLGMPLTREFLIATIEKANDTSTLKIIGGIISIKYFNPEIMKVLFIKVLNMDPPSCDALTRYYNLSVIGLKIPLQFTAFMHLSAFYGMHLENSDTRFDQVIQIYFELLEEHPKYKLEGLALLCLLYVDRTQNFMRDLFNLAESSPNDVTATTSIKQELAEFYGSDALLKIISELELITDFNQLPENRLHLIIFSLITLLPFAPMFDALNSTKDFSKHISKILQLCWENQDILRVWKISQQLLNTDTQEVKLCIAPLIKGLLLLFRYNNNDAIREFNMDTRFAEITSYLVRCINDNELQIKLATLKSIQSNIVFRFSLLAYFLEIGFEHLLRRRDRVSCWDVRFESDDLSSALETLLFMESTFTSENADQHVLEMLSKFFSEMDNVFKFKFPYELKSSSATITELSSWENIKSSKLFLWHLTILELIYKKNINCSGRSRWMRLYQLDSIPFQINNARFERIIPCFENNVESVFADPYFVHFLVFYFNFSKQTASIPCLTVFEEMVKQVFPEEITDAAVKSPLVQKNFFSYLYSRKNSLSDYLRIFTLVYSQNKLDIAIFLMYYMLRPALLLSADIRPLMEILVIALESAENEFNASLEELRKFPFTGLKVSSFDFPQFVQLCTCIVEEKPDLEMTAFARVYNLFSMNSPKLYPANFPELINGLCSVKQRILRRFILTFVIPYSVNKGIPIYFTENGISFFMGKTLTSHDLPELLQAELKEDFDVVRRFMRYPMQTMTELDTKSLTHKPGAHLQPEIYPLKAGTGDNQNSSLNCEISPERNFTSAWECLQQKNTICSNFSELLNALGIESEENFKTAGEEYWRAFAILLKPIPRKKYSQALFPFPTLPSGITPERNFTSAWECLQQKNTICSNFSELLNALGIESEENFKTAGEEYWRAFAILLKPIPRKKYSQAMHLA